jgi:drug/metabolite transporter (DMT)-like permease
MTAIGAFGSGWADTGRRSVDDSAMPDRAARARTAGLLLLLTPVIWGATFPAAKVALRDVSPWAFVAWSRGLGLVAILVVLALWRPPRAAWTQGLVPAGAVLGALMTAGYVLQTVGINHTTATNAGFITVLYVVLAPAGAALIGRHSPDRVDRVCLGLALIGLGLLSIRDGRLHAGDFVVLASAAAFAGHIIAVDVLVERYQALPLALAQMAASAVLTAAIAVPAGPQAGEVASLWWIFVLTGVLGSGIAFSVQVMAQQSLSPVRASILLAAEALVAAIVAAIWLGERLSARGWVGAAVVLVAIVVSELSPRRAGTHPGG